MQAYVTAEVSLDATQIRVAAINLRRTAPSMMFRVHRKEQEGACKICRWTATEDTWWSEPFDFSKRGIARVGFNGWINLRLKLRGGGFDLTARLMAL